MNPIDPRVDPRLVPFGSKAVVVAEKQDEFNNLPSIFIPQRVVNGALVAARVVTRWELTDDERMAVLRGEDIYITIFGVPIRPLSVTVGPVDWTKD